jgi:hypothetical protein
MTRFTLWSMAGVVTILLVGGCGGYHHGAGGTGHGSMEAVGEKAEKDMAAMIERAVQDPEKAKRAKVVAGDIMEEVKRAYVQDRQSHRKLYELNANYDAKQEEFVKILDEAHSNRAQSATKILALRFTLKDMLTPQEWKTLSDEMRNYRRGYQHD